MNRRDPEQATQAEVQEQGTEEGEDPTTRREALETELMDEGASEVGEEIGDPTP